MNPNYKTVWETTPKTVRADCLQPGESFTHERDGTVYTVLKIDQATDQALRKTYFADGVLSFSHSDQGIAPTLPSRPVYRVSLTVRAALKD